MLVKKEIMKHVYDVETVSGLERYFCKFELEGTRIIRQEDVNVAGILWSEKLKEQ